MRRVAAAAGPITAISAPAAAKAGTGGRARGGGCGGAGARGGLGGNGARPVSSGVQPALACRANVARNRKPQYGPFSMAAPAADLTSGQYRDGLAGSAAGADRGDGAVRGEAASLASR